MKKEKYITPTTTYDILREESMIAATGEAGGYGPGDGEDELPEGARSDDFGYESSFEFGSWDN